MARLALLPLIIVMAAVCPGCGEPKAQVAPTPPPILDAAAPPPDLASPDAGPPVSKMPPPCLGYILYSTPTGPNETPLTSLADMNGSVVRTWPYSGFPSVMVPGGSLLVSRSMRAVDINLLQDTVELIQISWSGKLLWSFSAWDDDETGSMMSRQHHDTQRAGNPVGYHAPGQQAAASGVTTVLGHLTRTVPAVTDWPLTDDVIYQVAPDGKLLNFTWRAADHLDEFGFDQGALSDIKGDHHYDDQRGTVDWLHVNSMSLLGRNPWYESDGDSRFAPDNILIGSREASFLAIISAETGEVVWRLGPDLSAGKPGAGVGQLVGPHHAHMIPHGLPGAGNILVFDNGGISGYGGPTGYPRYQRGHSRVVEINPRTLSKVWEYGPSAGGKKFFSPALGSVQRLPSGNTLVSSGLEGRLLEVTVAGEVPWSLQLKNKDGPMVVYRAYRVPPEWLPAGVNPAGYREWSKACRAD